MSTTLIVIAILAILILIGVAGYNRLIRLNVSVDEAFAQIEVQLKRRSDLIPNLVETVKGSSLTIKEKVALSLFGKKIEKKILAGSENGVNVGGEKSQLIALILCILVGALGIHRFYLGYTWQGVVQLLTAGGCGVWALIDLIRIITGDLKPKEGDYDKTL